MAVSNSILCQLTNIKQIVRSGNAVSNFLSRLNNYTNNVCLYSTTTAAATNETVPKEKPQKKMSKAMLAYLERAREHDMFVQNEKVAFQIGKRHLANMMGEDPEHFTQADIDRAIAYLLPSGLYDKAARPIMKPPEELFPPRKAAQFDETGRPHHTMFYTVSPHYYRMLYDIVESLQNLNNLEDNMISKGVAPDPQKQLQLQSSRWVSAPELEKILVERVDENKYDYFLSTIERLTAHPYSYQVEELIMKYRRPMQSLVTSYVIPPLEYDENGRPYVVVPDCKRKSARGQVILKGKGSGKIMINGIRLENYFDTVQSREQVIFPLQFVNMMDEFDVETTVTGGGPSGQAGAIRWGIAWALRSFVDIKTMDKMRIAGLLTRDWRRRERKKPGQEGARRKFTWKKR